MPIYEESYRPWHGQLESRPRTWWVIAKTGIQLLWKKAMILLLLLASIPFFVRAVQIYLMTRFGDNVQIAQAVEGFKINPGFFFGFLQGQNFFLILILILAGAGLIANDRKFKALSIYFSKPVSFWDYILGKFLVIGFYGNLVTLVPGLLLFLIRVLLSKDASFFQEYYWIPFSLTGHVFLSLVTFGGLVLALSASARGTRSAAILFFALIAFPDLFREILSRVPEVGLMSLSAVLRQTGSLLFGVERPFQFSLWLAFVVVGVVWFLCLWVLREKVKPTEIVK
ncbi:MAG: ABC transporter permease subunit [bacterium]